MGVVMIKCPQTGRAIPTGMKADRERFRCSTVFFAHARSAGSIINGLPGTPGFTSRTSELAHCGEADMAASPRDRRDRIVARQWFLGRELAAARLPACRCTSFALTGSGAGARRTSCGRGE